MLVSGADSRGLFKSGEKMIYQANQHYGVLPIWFIVFSFMLGLGLFIDSRRNYKVD